MASKLGCAVWVLRKVEVGEITLEDAARNSDAGYRVGEWDDREDMNCRRGDKTGKFWLAEEFVKPIISKEDGEAVPGNGATGTVLENSLVVREDIFLQVENFSNGNYYFREVHFPWNLDHLATR